MTVSWKDRRLKTAEAADYLGLVAATLHKMRSEGGGPEYLKVGRQVWYDPADLDKWLETRRRTKTEPRRSKTNAQASANQAA